MLFVITSALEKPTREKITFAPINIRVSGVSVKFMLPFFSKLLKITHEVKTLVDQRVESEALWYVF